MINFDEGLMLIESRAKLLPIQTINLVEALGFFVAKDIYAPIDLPPFDNSAVDGFAVRRSDLSEAKSLKIAAMLRAIRQEPYHLPHGHAARITTGAPIPIGADAVIMKEDVRDLGDFVELNFTPMLSQNIRFKGEDIKCGQQVASAGTKITPQLLGLLLGLGIAKATVFSKPRVAFVATGDELVEPPAPCSFGQVYSLNGAMIRALCWQRGIRELSYSLVGDSQAKIEEAIFRALDADVILLCGGMSKGEHDLGLLALGNLGVETIFYQGKWRPGKPLFFGQRGRSFVFGLPGNPVAAFVAFKVFVEALLDKMEGHARTWQLGTLSHDFHKNQGFAHFARAHRNDCNELSILAEQGSHQIAALSRANAICYFDADSVKVGAGSRLKYIAI